jgi:hypothetical protein
VNRIVVLFQSTHDAIKAERICIADRLECKIVAVPRSISSDCGIAIELKEELMPAVAALLEKNNIPFSRRPLPNDGINS